MDMAHPVVVCLLLCLWYGTTPSEAGLTKTCYLDDRRQPRGRFCGESGNETIKLICRRFPGKRSVRYIDTPGGNVGVPIKFTASKRTALSYLGKRSDIQGFTCECCIHMCAFQELREYCH